MVPKFRGKRKDNGEWVVGVPIPNSFCNVVHMIPILLTDKVAYPPERLHEYLIEIVPETLGQSTGLKDKNGVEIYEGNIYRYKYYTGGGFEYRSSIIEWETTEIAYEGVFHGYEFDNYEIEVIGNVYQNKDLLEGE